APAALVHGLRDAEARAGQERRDDHRRQDVLPAGSDDADAGVRGGDAEPAALAGMIRRQFSSRVPSELGSNRLSRAIGSAGASGEPLIDLTQSNPTRVGLDYPDYLLSALADARGLKYEPAPFGLVAARQAVARDYARRGVELS